MSNFNCLVTYWISNKLIISEIKSNKINKWEYWSNKKIILNSFYNFIT